MDYTKLLNVKIKIFRSVIIYLLRSRFIHCSSYVLHKKSDVIFFINRRGDVFRSAEKFELNSRRLNLGIFKRGRTTI